MGQIQKGRELVNSEGRRRDGIGKETGRGMGPGCRVERGGQRDEFGASGWRLTESSWGIVGEGRREIRQALGGDSADDRFAG